MCWDVWGVKYNSFGSEPTSDVSAAVRSTTARSLQDNARRFGRPSPVHSGDPLEEVLALGRGVGLGRGLLGRRAPPRGLGLLRGRVRERVVEAHPLVVDALGDGVGRDAPPEELEVARNLTIRTWVKFTKVKLALRRVS